MADNDSSPRFQWFS